MSKKVIVAGHICLDITPIFPHENVKSLHSLLVPGKLVQMKEADVHTGGAVANTGLAMKLFGADVSLMGKVGNDEFGEMIKNILNKYNVNKGLIVSENVSTSYSIVLSVPGFDRIFLHNPGANDTFTYEDISQDILKEASLFHFGYPTIMKSLYDNDGDELINIFKNVKSLGIATSLDMSAIDPVSEAGDIDWEKILSRVLPYTDFFMPSFEELYYMFNKKTATEVSYEDVKVLSDKAMSYGVKVLVIKCGELGMYYRTSEVEILKKVGKKIHLNIEEWADKEGFESSFIPDRILSGTGAGDTSIAAFLTSILNGYSVEYSIRLGTAAGACCVTSYDALSGLMPLEDMEKKIKSGWKKRGDNFVSKYE